MSDVVRRTEGGHRLSGSTRSLHRQNKTQINSAAVLSKPCMLWVIIQIVVELIE